MSVAVNEKNATDEVIALIEKSVTGNPVATTQRKEALEAFKKLGLPIPKAEEYRHTPITRIIQKNFSFEKLSSPAGEVRPADFFIPDIDANVIVLINGILRQEHCSIISPSSEIKIQNLTEALGEKDSVAAGYVGQFADVKADPFTAWNAAAWTHGVFIQVPDNAVVNKPVLIYNLHDARDGQVISAIRNLFILGKSSEVTIVEKFDSLGEHSHFSNSVTEAVVGPNAGLELYSVQNDSGNRYQQGLTHIHQSDSSRVNTFTFTLNGKLVRNNLQLSLDGEGIESHMFGLYLVTGDTLADNHTVVDHRKPNSFSNEIYKGIMDGNSKGVFNGKIYVRPQAQKTNAFQANRNILLSDKAGVNTKPQLEIWADDVKCSHGCTTGQLDEEAMFYLQARGINKETARAMMLYAFAVEILENVKNTELKEYFDHLVSERLHKNF
ncbi:MAG TPA: Fe-S cluster assembly protein SufD [Chryseolinea sp.]